MKNKIMGHDYSHIIFDDPLGKPVVENKTYTLTFWAKTNPEDCWTKHEFILADDPVLSGLVADAQKGHVGLNKFIYDHIESGLGEGGLYTAAQIELHPLPVVLEDPKEDIIKSVNYYDRFRKNGVFSG